MENTKGKVRVVIPVTRKGMREMEDFYSRALGFAITEEGDVLLGGDGGCVGRFVYREGKGVRSQEAILDIEIEKDFGAYCRHVKACGGLFDMVARMIAGYAAHLRDPSDNLITIACYEDDAASDEIVYGWKETVTID
ncbi:VOC family protein [Burkholderia cepacia]|uniref:VOC family protein n=1 Tax=Burkholderia cepacia TaxID=292 RepID=UPI001CF1DB2C|nr:VOC family protein [Burkholderia cepacia]MCA8328308.1 VOC family protein [Burkholderia cepacia]